MDRSFVMATFLKGLYYGEMGLELVPKDIFMANYRKVAEMLIARSQVKIACLKEDPDVILGYSILSPDFQGIHWVYVKSAWRSRGIARSLTPQFPSYATHMTKLGRSLMSKFENFIYNPFN